MLVAKFVTIQMQKGIHPALDARVVQVCSICNVRWMDTAAKISALSSLQYKLSYELQPKHALGKDSDLSSLFERQSQETPTGSEEQNEEVKETTKVY